MIAHEGLPLSVRRFGGGVATKTISSAGPGRGRFRFVWRLGRGLGDAIGRHIALPRRFVADQLDRFAVVRNFDGVKWQLFAFYFSSGQLAERGRHPVMIEGRSSSAGNGIDN